jgi:hypothetical protein
MKSLLEAAAIIMLLFLTPLIAVWVLVSLARVIENIGICQSMKGSLGQQELVLQAEPFLCHADRELSLYQVRRTQ